MAPSPKTPPVDWLIFKTLAKHLPFGITIWRNKPPQTLETGQPVFANRSALKIIHRTKKEILHQSMGQIFPRLSKTPLPKLYQTMLQSGKPQRIKDFVYADDRISKKHFQVDLLPLAPEHLGIFFTDISRELQAKAQLKEKMKELERLNEFMVGREIKMMELKAQLREKKTLASS